MSNTGYVAWTGAGWGPPDPGLASQNPAGNTVWGPSFIGLNDDAYVAPGETRQFDFYVYAPSTPGTYDFSWQMMSGGVYFGEQTPTIAVPVGVDPIPDVSFTAPTPATIPVGDTYDMGSLPEDGSSAAFALTLPDNGSDLIVIDINGPVTITINAESNPLDFTGMVQIDPEAVDTDPTPEGLYPFTVELQFTRNGTPYSIFVAGEGKVPVSIEFTTPTPMSLQPAETYDMGIMLPSGRYKNFDFSLPDLASPLTMTQVTGPVNVNLNVTGASDYNAVVLIDETALETTPADSDGTHTYTAVFQFTHNGEPFSFSVQGKIGSGYELTARVDGGPSQVVDSSFDFGTLLFDRSFLPDTKTIRFTLENTSSSGTIQVDTCEWGIESILTPFNVNPPTLGFCSGFHILHPGDIAVAEVNVEATSHAESGIVLFDLLVVFQNLLNGGEQIERIPMSGIVEIEGQGPEIEVSGPTGIIRPGDEVVVSLETAGIQEIFFTIFNPGDDVLHNISVFPFDPPFAVGMPPDSSLEPGLTTDFSITYNTANGEGSTDISVTSNAVNVPDFNFTLTVLCQSDCPGRNIAVTDANGNRIRGTHTVALPVGDTHTIPFQILNIGTESLQVNDLALSGANRFQLDQDPTPVTLAVGAAPQEFTLTFNAANLTEGETYETLVTVTSDAQNAPSLVFTLRVELKVPTFRVEVGPFPLGQPVPINFFNGQYDIGNLLEPDTTVLPLEDCGDPLNPGICIDPREMRRTTLRVWNLSGRDIDVFNFDYEFIQGGGGLDWSWNNPDLHTPDNPGHDVLQVGGVYHFDGRILIGQDGQTVETGPFILEIRFRYRFGGENLLHRFHIIGRVDNFCASAGASPLTKQTDDTCPPEATIAPTAVSFPHDTPPSFDIEAGSNRYYRVEIALATSLFTNNANRICVDAFCPRQTVNRYNFNRGPITEIPAGTTGAVRYEVPAHIWEDFNGSRLFYRVTTSPDMDFGDANNLTSDSNASVPITGAAWYGLPLDDHATAGAESVVSGSQLNTRALSSDYGPRDLEGGSGTIFHVGIDIPVATGHPVYAIADGEILTNLSGTLNRTDIDHGGFNAGYIHLDRSVVAVGDIVVEGQLIGYSGSVGTPGPHLHLDRSRQPSGQVYENIMHYLDYVDAHVLTFFGTNNTHGHDIDVRAAAGDQHKVLIVFGVNSDTDRDLNYVSTLVDGNFEDSHHFVLDYDDILPGTANDSGGVITLNNGRNFQIRNVSLATIYDDTTLDYDFYVKPLVTSVNQPGKDHFFFVWDTNLIQNDVYAGPHTIEIFANEVDGDGISDSLTIGPEISAEVLLVGENMVEQLITLTNHDIPANSHDTQPRTMTLLFENIPAQWTWELAPDPAVFHAPGSDEVIVTLAAGQTINLQMTLTGPTNQSFPDQSRIVATFDRIPDLKHAVSLGLNIAVAEMVAGSETPLTDGGVMDFGELETSSGLASRTVRIHNSSRRLELDVDLEAVQSGAISTGGTSHLTIAPNTTAEFTVFVGTDNAGLKEAILTLSQAGVGDFSFTVTANVLDPLPTNVQASDGLYPHVAIDWNASLGAVSYAVYRNTANNFNTANKIGDSAAWTPLNLDDFTSTTSFNDYAAADGVTYYYWVSARKADGTTATSQPDTGFATPPTPDLILQNGSVSPTTLERGDFFAGSVDVAELNNGALPAGSFWVRFYYSDNATLDGADQEVGAAFKSSGPQPSPYHIDLFNMVIPTTASVGARYILIKADADGQVTESNEANNLLAIPITIAETLPLAPTGVSASDGTYTDKVRVTWNASTYATSYEVWRDTDNTTSGATRIANSVTGTTYDDTTAVPGTTYYYWVKAKNSAGTSGFSAANSGYALLTAPAAPTGVSASDGTDVFVAISWNASANADSYAIYRNTSNTTTGASKIGDSNGGHPLNVDDFTSPTSFNDYTASGGVTYYYWVRAENGAGVSGYSTSNSGYAVTPTPDLTLQNGSVSPTTLQRSQLFSGSVDVVETNNGELPTSTFWIRFYYSDNATLDGTDQQVGAFLKSSGPQSSPYHISLFNMSIPANASLGTRYILIKADADSQISETNEGNNVLALTITVQETPPPAPTGVSASDGTYTDKVRVTWNSTNGASSYEVWRDTDSTTSGATRIANSVTGTTYDDTTAVPGTTYYYWVKAKNSGGTSGFSASNTGYRAVPVPAAPTGVTASDGTAVHVAISWNASAYADSYAIYRNTSNTTTGASKIGDSNGGHPLNVDDFTSPTSFNDYTASGGVTYYYWVIAENTAGVSGYSVSNSGFAVVPTPDLSAQNGSTNPTSAEPGEFINTIVDIVESNAGQLPTGTFWIRYYYSGNSTLDGNDDLIYSFLKSSGPQSSPYHLTKGMSIPANANLGTRYIIVEVDAFNDVSETNEGNNTLAIPITIAIPGLNPPGPTTASCEYTLSGKCYNSGPFTISAFSAGAHHYRVCRSNDTLGWGGCAVVMSNNVGSTYTVSGSHLPSDGYRRAYYFSACDSNNNCTAWADNDEVYVYMDADGTP